MLSDATHSTGQRYRVTKMHHKLSRIRKQEIFRLQKRQLFDKITPREKQIIKLVITGYSNPDVAQKLYISRSTVEQHRKNINRKLEIKSVINLVQYGLAYDLI